MTDVYHDRVLENTGTSGTGTITLAGAVAQYQSFASRFTDGNTLRYTIVDADGVDWEVGIGTYSAGTISRDTVLESSNADALVALSAGTHQIFNTPDATEFPTGETPGGSDTEMQYNNGGVFGGAASLLYNDGTGVTTALAAPVVKKAEGVFLTLQLADATAIGQLRVIDTGESIGMGLSAIAALSGTTLTTAFGAHALEANTSGGTDNAAFGNSALKAVTTGDSNVGIGGFAAATLVTGSTNTAVGDSAMSLCGTGVAENTAIGRQTLRSVTGDANTAVGKHAGQFMTSGSHNTVIGRMAGSAILGGATNVCVGSNSGASIVGGDNNVSLGASALGINVVDGDRNIAIGRSAEPSGDFSDTLCIGYLASVTASNMAAFGTAANPYKIGVNMNTPTATLHLPAVTATAGTAPLKFNSGTVLATPENGAFEWDGTHLYFTQGGSRTDLLAAGGSGTVTHTGALTAGALVIGNGTDDITVTTTGTGVVTALGVNVGSAGAVVVNGGALGTPSSGTLTNCTGLPLAGVVDSTTEALGVGSLELGHASDTTLTRVSAGLVAVEGVNLVRTTDIANLKITTMPFIIDGGGATITTGIKGDIQFDFACTINAVTLLADQSGSIVVDIWKDTYANYPPTGADSITASAKPTITTATKSTDSTLTGWTTSIAAGDTLRFNVDSVTTLQRVTLSLKVTKT